MVSPRALTRLLLLSLACSCATTKPAPDSLRVDELSIDGMKELAERDVTERIVTNATPWWSRWFPFLGGTQWFDVNTWQADLRRIARVYESHGYYQARVLEDVVSETGTGSVRLRVKVNEGRPALLASLDVQGLDAVPDLKPSLLAALPLKLGAVFLEEDWAKAKTELVQGLHEAGFAEASVTGEAVVDLDGPKVDGKLEVEPGQRFTFGTIFAPVTGSVVPSKLIIDVAKDELPRGSWYSDSALVEAQARVFQMGVFGAVKVTRSIPDRQKGEMPIIIDAREAPMRSLRAGIGAGGDLFRNELRVFGEYTNRNLGFTRLFREGALLDRLTLRGRVGYAVLPNIVEFVRLAVEREPTRHGIVFDVSAQYEVPRLFGFANTSLLTQVSVNRVLDAAFDYLAAEGKLGVLLRPRVDLSIYPSINFNGYLLASPVQQLQTTSASAAVGCPVVRFPFDFESTCLVSFLDVTTEWDRRDNKLEPKRGFYAALAVQAGLSRRSAEVPLFFKVVPEVRGYVSFGPEDRFTLSGKLRAGTLLGTGETPIVARFFSGGAYMRGFNQRRLSPMAVVPAGTGPLPSAEPGPDGQYCQRDPEGACLTGALGAAVPIGGDSLVEASVELRFALTDAFVLALFFDNGLVSTDPRFWLRFGQDFYSAVGVGVRLRTPLGPIRGDFAFRLPFVGGPTLQQAAGQLPVTPQPGCLVIGAPVGGAVSGAPDTLCTIHVSIGEAF